MKRLLILMIFSIFIVPVFADGDNENPYVEFRKETYKIQEEYLRGLVAHQEAVMVDFEDKLTQQKWQTNAIAIMVFVMVAMGLWLSYLQFRRDSENGEKSSIKLKLGSGTFELNSSVIGLAILALSFWFFQTYVDRVYSVEVHQVAPYDLTTFGVNQ